MPIAIDRASCGLSELGDPEKWVDQHGDALLRFALVRVGDRSTAEDLVQETLLAAWRGRHAFDAASTPRTWLVGILKRRVADHFRRVGRQPPTAAGAGADAIEHAPEPPSRANAGPEAAEFWRVITACTADLPEHLARAFRLRAFGDAEPAAICDAEGITRKNLSVRLHRARQLLRKCLETRWFASE